MDILGRTSWREWQPPDTATGILVHRNGVVFGTVDDVRHRVHLVGVSLRVGQKKVTSNWIQPRHIVLVSVVLDDELRVGNVFHLLPSSSGLWNAVADFGTVGLGLTLEPLGQFLEHGPSLLAVKSG